MKRFNAMYEILQFGKKEQIDLIMRGELDAAYQIEHARDMLIYFLNENPVKRIAERIAAMTQYTIDASGFWHYDALHFVSDEQTRALLIDLATKFNKKGNKKH